MKLVYIESPYAGDKALHSFYLEQCVKDSLGRGEAPFASHGFYTQFLNDDIPAERDQGMKAGFAWGRNADLVAVYTDHGISPGMKAGITRAEKEGIPVEYRRLSPGG